MDRRDRTIRLTSPPSPHLSHDSSYPLRHLSSRPISPEGHERKRRRTVREPNSETPELVDFEEEQPVESIDLTEVDKPSVLDKALAKQREDAVKAQQDGESEKGRSLLTAYKCPVCMDTPEDATTTTCGT